MKRKLIAAAVALILALSCLPFSAFSVIAEAFAQEKPAAEVSETGSPAEKSPVPVEPYWTVPSGYDEHDYNKCAAFLEQTDESGVKNGTKLDAAYDISDPTTWTGFTWTDEVPYRIKSVGFNDRDVRGILDLSGCTALERFTGQFIYLTKLDVSGCTALVSIYCRDCGIYELDVTGCTALESISIWVGSLTELDVSSCTALISFYCTETDLEVLNASGCTALESIVCTYSALTELDVSGCTSLKILGCYVNALTELDLSGCTALEELDCSGNALTELDLSHNPDLPLDRVFAIGNGKIGYCKNGVGCSVYAYPSENAPFNGWYNPSGELLSVENTFNVDGTNETTLIARFSYEPAGYNEHDYLKCAAFLEQEDENGVKNGTKLNPDYDVNDPTTWGDWDFQWNDEIWCRLQYVSLSNLDLHGELDLSGCTALEAMDCSNNLLTKLDVSGCTALSYIYCNNNALTELNLSGCTELTWLDCSNNLLTELDVSGCTALSYICCINNALTELDVSGCTALKYLHCYDNALTELDLSGCTSLEELDCSHNALTELDVSACAELCRMDCTYNDITELDLLNNPLLPHHILRADGPGTIGYEYMYDSSVHLYNSTVYAYANDGACFAGWYTSSGELISQNEEFSVYDTNETVIIARFRDAFHTVTFVDWDGTVLSEQQVEDGAAAAAPDDPMREGYTFIGWDTDFDCVTEDLTVTAQYELATMHITYTGAYTGTDEVPYGGDAVLPVYGTAGLHFTFTVNGEPWDGTNITSDVTVTVGIDIDVYTVVFFDPVGNEELSVQQVMFGGEAAAPDAPEHYGYTFAGWDADFSYVTGDMTVGAVYEPVEFTVIFTDGYGNVLETELVPFGSAAPAPEPPTVEGYTFTGWDADFSCVEADMTVNATWMRTVCTVTFTGVYTGTAEVFYGEDCELPVYPSEYLHYTFTVDGEPWDGLNVTSDVTVVVDAAPNSTLYTVTFVDWDGTVLSTQSVRYGNAAAAPADPVRVGWTFSGWDKPFDSVQHDLTVTALYEEGGLEPTIPGDVNGDGEVNSSDALVVMRCAMNLLTLSGQAMANADVNGDGSVNATDALLIMRLALAG